MRTLNGLIYSRKFWLAVGGAIQSISLHLAGVDPVVWVAIDSLLGVVIVAISIEDAGEKIGGSGKPEE